MFSLQTWEFGTEQHLKLITLNVKGVDKSNIGDLSSVEQFIKPDDKENVKEIVATDDCQNNVASTSLEENKDDPVHHHKHCRTITIALNDEPIDLIRTMYSVSCHKIDCELESTVSNFTDDIRLGSNWCVPDNAKINSRTLLNLIILSVCVSFILGNVRASLVLLPVVTGLNNNSNLVLALLYIVCGLSSFCISLKSNGLAAKSCILIGFSGGIIWIGSIYQPQLYILLPAAIIAGIGMTILWNGQLLYLADCGFGVGGRNLPSFAHLKSHRRWHLVFFLIVQTGQIWTCLASSIYFNFSNMKSKSVTSNYYSNCSIYKEIHIFSSNSTNSITSKSFPKCEDLCGINFSIIPLSNKLIETEKPYSTFILCLIGFSIFCLGAIAFGLEKNAIKLTTPDETEEAEDCCQDNFIETIQKNLKNGLKSTKRFLFLFPMILMCGYVEAFFLADFNRAFIGCPFGMDYVGYFMSVLVISNIVFYVCCHKLAIALPKQITLITFAIASLLCPLCVFLLYYLNPISSKPLLIITTVLWGCFNSTLEHSLNYIVIQIKERTNLSAALLFLRTFRLFGFAFSCGASAVFHSFKLKLFSLVLLYAISIILVLIYFLKIESTTCNQKSSKPKENTHE